MLKIQYKTNDSIIGIYKITNNVNHKIYIGKATNIKTRWKQHISQLNNNKHYNKHLQNSWNKYIKLYNEDNFTFDILEECNEEELNDKEKYWIIFYKSNNPLYGYNKTKGGDGISKGHIPWNKGKKDIYSKEVLEINRQKHIGKKHLKEAKEKIGLASLGRNKGNKNGMYGKPSPRLGIKTGKPSPKAVIITQEMLNDIKNGIRYKEFCNKYKVSQTIWIKAKKEEINNVTNTEVTNAI